VRKSFLLPALGLLAGPVTAAPVYVQCVWYNGAYTVHHDYTLDEQRGTAARYVEEMDHADPMMPVVFTPDFVIFDDRASHARINRHTLEYFIEFPTAAKYRAYDGKCELRQAPTRKF
jgi:hypothetical protein